MKFKSLWNALLVSPAVFGAMLGMDAEAFATATPAVMEVKENPIEEAIAPTPAIEEDKEESQTLHQKTEELVSNTAATDTAPITTPSELMEASAVKIETPASVVMTPNQSTVADLAEIPAIAPRSVTADADVLEQIDVYSNPEGADSSLEQVTNVSQLQDVEPTDWAYEALRSLVERYGCIAGYPDGTFRGNRALSRYEFAAGLNACLQQIEKLIAASSADFVTKADLTTLQRLIDEFGAELATLRTRIDNLEGRTAFLESHQFSTTTKLQGEAVFALAGIFTGEDATGEDIDNVTIFGHRTRLNFETSFTGKDLLRTRLQAEGLGSLTERTLTPEGNLFFSGATDNDVFVDAFLYAFPLGERTEVVVAANAGAADDFTDTVNFLDGDGTTGALSTFGTRPPIYYLAEGAGVGLRQQLGDRFELSLGYLAGDAANPEENGGLFNGPYGALAQLLIKPSDRLKLGLTYIHSYNNNDTGTGSNLANFQGGLARFFDTDIDGSSVGGGITNLGFSTNLPLVSNSYGVELSWQLSDRFVLGGWVGYTNTRNLSTLGGLIDRGKVDIWNWAVTLAFPDLGKQGNLAGIIVGMEPKVTGSTIDINPGAVGALTAAGIPIPPVGEDDDTSLHIEAFYQYQVTDNIAITPGVIWLTAPDHNNRNDDIVIGTIRTTFTF
ncbi:iron uptake porin [Coleofasciculus sp. H7-2]|uniref:iron uptake porin n=1 Tax=Coleofasciculus sp. H7-2 TaxID=3351545 RepID=UPI00366ECFBD